MHEGRKDPPDIDLDFCSLRRDEVRFEMVRRYEKSGAAEAATVQTMSLRGAVRVAARALGHSPREINDLSRHVPTRFRDRDRVYAGLDGWKEALGEPAMRGHPLQDVDRYRLLLELSAGLAGRIREAGTHSGGMVFGTAEHHLSELVPLEPSGTEGLPRCQYDKDDLERVGIPKLDLLGLRMHTALRKAGALATERTGRKVDPYDLPPEDGATYALIRTGKNAGMFQLESPGQMHLSRRLKPERFADLVAQISLFRPGPVRGDLVTPFIQRKNGEGSREAILPQLEEVLRSTYGVLVYQEQVLAVANAVAGFTLAEGDQLRRAMTKDRGPDSMSKLRREFLVRAGNNGVTAALADEVFSWMEGFSVYGFSAAHAASFAELSYASAYMRRHHPAEFFCALLNSQPMGFYSPRLLLNEARRIRLGVLPPDINRSEKDFTVEDTPTGPALRVGLRYCKGLSERAISSIVSERRHGPFVSVADLYGRTSVERDSLREPRRGRFPGRATGGGRPGAVAPRGQDSAKEASARGAAGDTLEAPRELVDVAGEEERRAPAARGDRQGEDGVGGPEPERPPSSPLPVSHGARGVGGGVERGDPDSSPRDPRPRGGPHRVPPEPPDEERSPGLLPPDRGRKRTAAGDPLPPGVPEVRRVAAPRGRVPAGRPGGADRRQGLRLPGPPRGEPARGPLGGSGADAAGRVRPRRLPAGEAARP